MSVLAVDIGTSRCKAALYDEALHRERLVDTSTPGIGVDGTFDLWAIVDTTIRMIAELAGDGTTGGTLSDNRIDAIEAVAVTSFLSHVFVDSSGNIERNGLTWSWKPAADAIAVLEDACIQGDYRLERPLGPELLAPRLVSLARERRRWAGSLSRVIALKDVVREVLSGKIRIDGHNLVLRGPPATLVTDWSVRDYSLIRDRWDRPVEPVIAVLERLGFSAPTKLIPRAFSPEVQVAPVTPAVPVTPAAPLSLGSTDGTAAMYGGGVLHPGTVVGVFGTTDVMMRMYHGSPSTRPAGLGYNSVAGSLSSPDGVTPTLAGGSTAVSGGMQGWLREILDGGGEGWVAVPPGADGLVFVPGVSGERAPWNVPGARGALVGVEGRHSASHVTRALLEATTFRARMILEQLVDERDPGEKGRVTLCIGGGNRSVALNRLRASIFPVPVVQRNENELSLCGAAIFAWCGMVPSGRERRNRYRALSALVADDVVRVEPGDEPYDDRVYRRWRDINERVYREYA